ncbi:ATP-binding protein [Deinococcus oregonensis]|uniref:histidine kinase n=1 Tax=Deinococcus oregonensis TaxID=1805970 RepID=A0ABV6ASP2_9DEIO
MTDNIHSQFDAEREVFVGGGEMARRMLAHDWTETPLGAPQHWPPSLKTAVRIMLTSRFAMWMAWGDDLTFFCNDAYLPTLGVKHVWALGARTAQVWAEIWKEIGPRIVHVLNTGEATWDQGLRLLLERSGYPEETYHTFSYSPLANDSGRVTGMLCVVAEESERVVGERRLRVLRDLAARMSEARTTSEVYQAVKASLNTDSHDLPFALVYQPAGPGQAAQRTFVFGLNPEHPAAPTQMDAEEAGAPWPVQAVLTDGRAQLIADLTSCADLPSGPWDRAPTRALALPIARSGGPEPVGVFVAGLNPYRPLDDSYRGFLDLFVGQLAAGLANAAVFENERQRAEALTALDRAKTAFFANASHELRTPLTLMLGPLEDLLTEEQHTLAPPQRATLEMAHRNSLRLLRLVNGLLDFSRLESGEARTSYAPTDLAAFTADLAHSFGDAMERAGLRYVVTTPELPEPVYVDPDLWEKVVLNLLSNAFKFTLTGEVRVSLQAEGQAAVLRVQDSGVGVPGAELPRLFERFHRVEGQPGRSFEGTGIGLALVQEIVELHGGQVEVQSREGEGTTFTVRLPFGSAHLPRERLGAPRELLSTATGALPYVQEALRWLPHAESQLALPESGAAVSPGPRGRILVADDNADLRDYIQGLLAPHHEVQVVADGAAALSAVQEAAPDLVITDVMMPRLDGFGLLQALRAAEATRTLPVIMLSARAGEEARVQGLEAGADDYLVKPFSARELLAKVNANLTLSRVRSEALMREQAYTAQLEARVLERTAALRDALEHSESQALELSAILASLPDAVYVGDLSGIKRANQPALALLGFHELAQLDRPVPDLDAQLVLRDAVTHDRLTEGESPFVKALTGEANQRDVLLRHTTTGEDRVVRIAAAPLRRGMDVVGAVSVVSDMTERTRLQDVLEQANVELKRSNAELERFAYIASHDLQEPIRTVGSFAGLLGRKYGALLDERGQQYLQTIERGAERMKALVDDLLVFSRLNAERPPLSSVNTNEPLREALARLDALARSAGAQIRVQALPQVRGDAPRLAQLFQNLLGNAIKFRRAGVIPEIQVGAQREGDWWTFTVADNGIGISERYQERIFEMFSRLHGRDMYEGTGLGLAICQKIVEGHGGRLWVSSTPDTGSAFHFTLPAEDA